MLYNGFKNWFLITRMKVYYNFIIAGDAFSYYKTASKVDGSAHDTLKKIEYILTHYNNLTYKGNERDVGLKLKGFAATIVTQYQVRERKIHWLIRILFCFCIGRKYRQIAATHARIKALSDPPLPKPKPDEEPPTVFSAPLPRVEPLKRFTFPFDRSKDTVLLVLGYLDYPAISNFCTGNKQIHALAEPFRKKMELPVRDCIDQLKSIERESRPAAVYQAARTGEVQWLSGLLLLGANPNAHRDRNQDQALHWTAYHGNSAATKILLKYNAQIDQPGVDHQTPFCQAHIQYGRGGPPAFLEVMQCLLEKRADPNQRVEGSPLLHKAIKNRGGLEVVKLLLAANADPQLRDGQGNYAALHVAALSGNVALARLIVEARAPIDQPTGGNMGRSALFSAYSSLQGQPRQDMMQFLLESNANPNLRDDRGESLVDHLVWNEHRDLLEMMIDHRAEINQLVNGKTPLGWACSSQQPNIEVIRLLLDRGADPHIAQQNGEFPLSYVSDNAPIAALLYQRL